MSDHAPASSAIDALPDPPPSSPRPRAEGIVAFATVLALLYFAREILVPITLAVILSLLIAPLVRGLKRIGLGQAPSVLSAVSVLAIFLVGLTTIIGSQLVRMATSLPQYEETIHSKVDAVRAMTITRMEVMRGEAGRVMSKFSNPTTGAPKPPLDDPQPSLAQSTTTVPVEIQESPPTPLQLIARIIASIWVPLETAGIVLLVLVFMLLEQEALRDRFIRLAGATDLRATTAAINDAGERLSRFFVSQFAVNFGVGAVIWAGLASIGLPHAPLWAALAAVLRFVPYVGIWIAAFFAALLAAAVDPGWSLMLMTLGLFVIVEMIAGQLVEPQLYGHSTGLSPLSVVIAAIFWSWMWGPVGLIVSTPLTLCLVVAGRHVKALNFLEILLGDMPALTMSQRFYQRALSGDSDEIIARARIFLKRKSFATYCDCVLMPALQLARIDLAHGMINPQQQIKVRSAITRVIEALGTATRNRSQRQRHSSVLDDPSIGRQLRHQRENVFGRWQGPLDVPPGSVLLCVGLGSQGDDLATEILVRILRDLNIDARHLSIEDIETTPPPGATPDSVATVCIVSADPSLERERGAQLSKEIRRRIPDVWIIAVLLPELLPNAEPIVVSSNVNQVANSFEQAVQHAMARASGSSRTADQM